MRILYESLQFLGHTSLDSFWFPIGIWTLVALVAFILIKSFRKLSPLYHYHFRVATLVAIPFGLVSTAILQSIRSNVSSSNAFDSAIFIVESPISYSYSPRVETAIFSPNWFEPTFILGVFSSALFVISLIMIVRLIWSYFTLKKLDQSLAHTQLGAFEQFESLQKKDVRIAYYNHPLVPFTFGWKQPIIVLPNSIKDDPEKVRMTIQHELVHIQRGDYLLQLILSVIESIFWFHPLIHFGSREIEIYREISCDHEVLNTSGISQKNYASMLYELVPFDRGIGSFSVNMAVKNSTLKQRIETMKYHKLHKSSLKRSLIMLFAMTLLITLPIACSDLQGQQTLKQSEIEDEYYSMMIQSVSINGILVQDKLIGGGGGSGIGSVYLGTRNNGIFVFSLAKINGAKKRGKISGNKINFDISDLDVEIISSTPILKNKEEAGIWVRHFPEYNAYGTSGFFPRTGVDFETEFERFKTFENEAGEYYKVTDKMPELIGGLIELQKKVVYPLEAKKKGIQGRVVVQFIVDEEGNVIEPKITRGIGGGCDEAALEAITKVEFSPGIKNGVPVKTQYSLPIIFSLEGSTDDKEAKNTFSNTYPDGRVFKVFILEDSNGVLAIRVTNKNNTPLEGSTLKYEGLEDVQGIVAGKNGLLTLRNLDTGKYNFIVSHPDYNPSKFTIDMK